MGDRQTIADSKRAFHQQFPYVIAPLYRRLADELLVELHLLSHQKQFESNPLFAVGLDTLFKALCGRNGFDAEQLRRLSDTTMADAAGQTVLSLPDWLKRFQLAEGSHYSRLMAIGLLNLLEVGQAHDDNADASASKDKATEIAESLNMSPSRVEKDINLFLSNRERMQQAVELMEETLASERRKREQRLAESTQGSTS